MSFKTILVAGASRGIGLAVAEHLSSQCDRLLTVSRTVAPIGEWIQADLSDLAGVGTVTKTIGEDRLDALLYMGGERGKPMRLPASTALKNVPMRTLPE